jgi:hypothetical protein
MIEHIHIQPRKIQTMHLKLTNSTGFHWTIPRYCPRAALGLFLLVVGHPLAAQEVLMPPVQVPNTPPAVQEYQQQNPMMVFTPAGFISGRVQTPFQWGPLALHPRASYQFLDGTGIGSTVSNHTSTVVQSISPGFLLNIGNHWTIDYSPTWNFYSSQLFRNTLDQSVRLMGGTTYEDWTLGLSQSYEKSSDPEVDTGTQTDEETYSTALNASYRINTKLSLDMGVNQDFVYTTQFESSREWSTADWLNYQFWPRLDSGLGAGFGYVNVDIGSDMTYERIEARVRWRISDKVGLQVHGGAEIRQFLGGGASDLVNPIAGGSIQYQPFEFTQLSLNADRVVDVSVLATASAESQVTETTSVTADLNQRLLGKLHLNLEGGYNTVNYVGSGGTATGRTDDYYTFNARLSLQFLKRATASIFYQYSDNSSTLAGYTFTSNQTGIELGYQF